MGATSEGELSGRPVENLRQSVNRIRKSIFGAVRTLNDLSRIKEKSRQGF